MKPVAYLTILWLVALAGCSTKKYLPKIFNPDMATVNANQTTLEYEEAGKGFTSHFYIREPFQSKVETQNDTELKFLSVAPSPHTFYTTESQSLLVAPLSRCTLYLREDGTQISHRTYIP